MKSVLQDWVMELPLKQQATLISATRGPDNLGKHNIGKQLTRYLRSLVLVPANPDWKNNPEDTFFRFNENSLDSYIKDFINDHDHYPHHFIMHLIHAFEIIAYNHPDLEVRVKHAEPFYYFMCEAFHMTPETKEELNSRLNI
jgi:hypothetical protein